MFVYELKYKNFKDEEKTKTLYFHISKTDMMRLFVKYPDGPEGIGKELEEISKSGDNERLFSEFEKYILLSYGERTEDGEGFDNGEEVTNKFRQSAAYDAFFMKVCSDSNLAANFIIGMFPDDLATNEAKEELKKEMLKAKMADSLGTNKEAKSTAELALEVSDAEAKSLEESSTEAAKMGEVL